MAKLRWRFSIKTGQPSLIDYALILILGASAFFVVDYFIYAFRVIAFPFDWDEDEGFHLYYALRLAKGYQIYFDPNSFPMIGNPYTPLYPFLGAGLLKIFGPSLPPLRFISFFSSLLTSIIIYALVRSETKKQIYGFLAAFLFIGNRWVTPWFPVARVDSLAIFLSVLSFYLAYKASGRGFLWLASLLLLAAAIYTRQSSIYMLPLVVVLGWRADKKRLISGVLIFLGLSAGAFLWLNLSSRGLFYKNIVTYTATDYSLSKLSHDFFLYARHFAPMLFLSAFCAALICKRMVKPLWAYLLIFSVMVTALGGKLGSSINYYIPLTVALSIASALAVGKAPEAVAPGWRPVLKGALICALAAQLAFFWNYKPRKPSEADLFNSRKVAKYVGSARGEVLTERRPSFAVLAGKEVLYDAVLTHFLYFKKYWDPRPLVGKVERGEFSLILIMGLFVPPELKAAAESNYMEIDQATLGTWYGTMNYRILLPKTIGPEKEDLLWGLAVSSLMGKLTSEADEGIIHFRLGVLYFNGRRLDKALTEFIAASAFGHGLQHSLWNAGAVFYKKGLYPMAARYFLGAASQGQEDASLRLHLANSFFLSGLLAKADAEYKTAVILEPGSATAYKNLAIFYINGLKDKKRAANYLRESIRLDPDQPDAAKMKAMVERLLAEEEGR